MTMTPEYYSEFLDPYRRAQEAANEQANSQLNMYRSSLNVYRSAHGLGGLTVGSTMSAGYLSASKIGDINYELLLLEDV